MAKITSITDLCAIIPLGNNKFESQNVADKMGNTANIGYGGSTLAFAINSASSTVKSHYHLYTAVGNYLGPVLTDRKMFCTVESLRDTKSFATREVRVSQIYPDGKNRLVLTMLADFQIAEATNLFTYSAKTAIPYSSVAETVPVAEYRTQLLKAGRITKYEAAAFDAFFSAMGRYFDDQPCPEGIGAQNLLGAAKQNKTTQDHLSLPDKTSAGWFKHREPLKTQAENICAVAYLMDGGLSFIPLTHSHLTLSDVGACSSLDFALRIFTNDVSINEWHIQELKTVTGGSGRTYAESRLWDEGGNMVVSMTQQSIMRPVPVKASL